MLTSFRQLLNCFIFFKVWLRCSIFIVEADTYGFRQTVEAVSYESSVMLHIVINIALIFTHYQIYKVYLKVYFG